MPERLVRVAGLPVDATVALLDSGAWEKGQQHANVLRAFAVSLLMHRRRTVRNLQVLSSPWPVGLNLGDISWRQRTRNSLDRAALLESPTFLATVKFGLLFQIPGMGVASVLDFAVTTEACIDSFCKSERQFETLLADVSKPTSETQQQLPDREGNIVEGLASIGGATFDRFKDLRLSDVVDQPWASQVSEQDPRFRDLLPKERGTVLERIEAATGGDFSVSQLESLRVLLQALPIIQEKMRSIDSLPLDTALEDYFRSLTGYEGTRLAAVMARLGCDGLPARTLKESARILGVSRERMRQLEDQAKGRMPRHPPYMPALDRAIALLSASTPLSIEAASQLMVKNKITSVPFDPRSVAAAAGLFQRSVPFSTLTRKKQLVVVSTPAIAFAEEAIREASRQTNRIGAVSVGLLASTLRNRGLDVEDDDLRSILAGQPDVMFLGSDWLTIRQESTTHNRLYNTVRHILSVVSPQEITSIRDGLRRRARFYGVLTVPPRDALMELLRQHAEFLVDDQGLVRSRVPLDYRMELSPTEQAIVDTLRSSPAGILDRKSLIDECERRGVNRNTCGVLTTYSDVLQHLATDIWGVRGAKVDPAAVEALRQANHDRPQQRIEKNFGWHPSGRPWFGFRLGPVLDNVVVQVPSGVSPYLAGRRFEAVGIDQSNVGTVVVDERGVSWGYKVFITRYGLDGGDILVAEFDLVKERVHLTVGEEELLTA